MGVGAEVIDYEDFMALTPLDDESWEKLKCKGENLMNAMHASDEQAGKYWNPILPSAESIWEDFSKSISTNTTPFQTSDISR